MLLFLVIIVDYHAAIGGKTPSPPLHTPPDPNHGADQEIFEKIATAGSTQLYKFRGIIAAYNWRRLPLSEGFCFIHSLFFLMYRTVMGAWQGGGE